MSRVDSIYKKRTRKNPASRRLAVALTGASGAIYGLRVLEELLRHDELEIHLTISASAQKVLVVEHGIQVKLDKFDARALKISNAERAIYHHFEDIAAPMASGSFAIDAMVIVPCSMGSVGGIAHGLSDDLIQRTADVMIKEKRPLIIVPREAPLSVIHLENLLSLARLGVTVLPAAPGFYGHPQSISDLVDFVAARVLDHLHVEHPLGPRWGENV